MSRSSLIFITLISCLLCSMFLTPVNTYAEGPTVQVEVMEKIPGAGCVDSKVTPKGYTCTIGSGFSSVMVVIGNLIKYFTYITALAAVLYIVINGILYSMSGLDAGAKDSAKKRIIQTLLGLVLLFLAGTILNAVAPWIYTA